MRGRLTASQYLTVAGNLCHYNLEPGSYYFMPDGCCYSRSTEGNSCLPRVVMRAFVGREQEENDSYNGVCTSLPVVLLGDQ